MIIFDTETTGLVKHGAPLSHQPRMIEFAGMKVDKELNVIDEMEALINPGVPLPPIITKITGLTDEKLKDKPSFAKVYPDLCAFFFGQHSMLAHNAPFDRNILKFDLQRIEKLLNFPWPTNHICSIAETRHLNGGKSLKMVALYKIATGKELEQKHRAMDDVIALLEIVKWMKSEKILTKIN